MASSSRGRPPSWGWLAFASSLGEAQAFLWGTPVEFPGSYAVSPVSLYSHVEPPAALYKQWPYADPNNIYGQAPMSPTNRPLPNSKRRSTLGRIGGGHLHFATFSLPGYEEGMRELCREAESSGLFVATHCFDQVPTEAMEGRWNAIRRKPGMSEEWLYQPAMIQYLLRNVVPAGDILLFTEASAELSFNETSWIKLMDTMTGDSGSSLIAFQRSDTPEYQYTKADVFREFGVWMDDVEVKSYQISASYFLARNVRPVHLFLTDWAMLIGNPRLLGDDPSHAPNSEEFVEHRHEVSLWSMMVKANRLGSNARPLHRVQELRLRILPYSGCDDLREVSLPMQAHCARHRKAIKNRLSSGHSPASP